MAMNTLLHVTLAVPILAAAVQAADEAASLPHRVATGAGLRLPLPVDLNDSSSAPHRVSIGAGLRLELQIAR
jgi:hypothetical protein